VQISCTQGEFAKHKELAKALKNTIFFAHPYAFVEERSNRKYQQTTKKLNYQSPKQIFPELCKKSVAFRS